jgi:hypothetical protein
MQVGKESLLSLVRLVNSEQLPVVDFLCCQNGRQTIQIFLCLELDLKGWKIILPTSTPGETIGFGETNYWAQGKLQ